MGAFMREFQVYLHSVQDVQEFVSHATTMGFPVTISDGFHRVNAQCFMEMFCLDLKRPLTVSAACSDLEFQQLRDLMASFLAS